MPNTQFSMLQCRCMTRSSGVDSFVGTGRPVGDEYGFGFGVRGIIHLCVFGMCVRMLGFTGDCVRVLDLRHDGVLWSVS